MILGASAWSGRWLSLVVIVGSIGGCRGDQSGVTQTMGASMGSSAGTDATGAPLTTSGSGPESASGTGAPTDGGALTGASGTTGPIATTDAATTEDSVASSTGDTTPSCPGGMKLVQAQAEGFVAGLERCPGRGVHRAEAVVCRVLPEVSACQPGACAGGCDDFSPGVCDEASPGDCACIYPCAVDVDCGPQAACLCGTSDDFIFGTGCRPASCLTDADCGVFTCGVSPSICRTGEALRCHTAQDECQSDEDCLPGADRCAFAAELERWVCSTYAICR